jgi:hypothetical protein
MRTWKQRSAISDPGPGQHTYPLPGGDGLVAARHLRHYGYTPSVFYPKRSKSELYQVGGSSFSYVDLMQDGVASTRICIVYSPTSVATTCPYNYYTLGLPFCFPNITRRPLRQCRARMPASAWHHSITSGLKKCAHRSSPASDQAARGPQGPLCRRLPQCSEGSRSCRGRHLRFGPSSKPPGCSVD